MILLAALAIVVLTVPATGGRLTRLASLQLRHPWTALTALVVQVLIITVAPQAMPAAMMAAIHILTYLLGLAFLWCNRHIPGMWLIAAGGVANFLAIAANDGVMPASPAALQAAGRALHRTGFVNSAAVAEPRLAFLGDIFAWPEPLPLANVYSIGDIVLVMGIAVAVHRLCGPTAERSADRFRPLMALPSFRRVWLAYGTSTVGDWVYILAVASSLGTAEGGAQLMAVLVIAQSAPSLIIGLGAGSLVDLLPRRTVMITCDVVRAIAVASLLLHPEPTPAHFIVVAVFLGAGNALYQPSMLASLPNIVPTHRLVAANALVGLTYQLSIALGPLLGGLLVISIGRDGAFAVNALTFLFSAAVLVRTVLPHGQAVTLSRHPVAAVREGLRYVCGSRLIRGGFTVFAVTGFAAALRLPMEPQFVAEVLGGGAPTLGVVTASWGGGMLAGSLLVPRLAARWSTRQLFAGGAGVVGVAVCAVSQSPFVAVTALLAVGAGAGNAVAVTVYETMLQQQSADAVRGRVLAAGEAVDGLAFLAGAALTAVITPAVGPVVIYLLSGGLFLLAAVSATTLLRPGPPPSADTGGQMPPGSLGEQMPKVPVALAHVVP